MRPPFGSANDPVNTAGFVSGHIARGDLSSVASDAWTPRGELLLDVRDDDEIETWGMLPGAIHIPLEQIRNRAHELPRDQKIVAYCQKGQRGYLATCTLMGLGFKNVSNLRGGFLQARLNGIEATGDESVPMK